MTNSENSTYIKLSNLITIEGLVPSLAAMLLCVSLAASNHPEGIPVVVNKHLETLKNNEEKVKWIEYVRNAIVKSSLICGVPRAINAQVLLYNKLSDELRSSLKTDPIIDQNEEDTLDLRASSLLRVVYGEGFDNASYILRDSCPDIWSWIKRCYGDILANYTYLNCIDTELDIIVSLIQMGTLRQLRDHLNGAKNVGATAEQIKAAETIGYSVRDAFI